MPPRSTTAGGDSLTGRLLAFVTAALGIGHVFRDVVGLQGIEQPDDAVVFTVAVAAAVIAGWWAANLAAWTRALRSGRALPRFALPGTRRLAQFLLAVTLSTSCVAEADTGPSMVLVGAADATGSSADRPTTTSVAPPTTTSIDLEATTTPTQPETGSQDEPAAAPTEPTPTEPTPIERTPIERTPIERTPGERPPVASSIPAHQVVVSEGDNLWSLSADALHRHGVEAPEVGTVAGYWRLVVAANQVRSGNADLIVPGETIDLPAHTVDA